MSGVPANTGGVSRWVQSPGLLLLVVALHVLVILAARHFPFIDSINHLVRYVAIAQHLSGRPPVHYVVELAPIPYIGVDLFGALLVRSMGPEGTTRVLGVLGIVLPVLALHTLLRSTCPARQGWTLVAALTAFNVFFLVGSVDYVFPGSFVGSPREALDRF